MKRGIFYTYILFTQLLHDDSDSAVALLSELLMSLKSGTAPEAAASFIELVAVDHYSRLPQALLKLGPSLKEMNAAQLLVLINSLARSSAVRLYICMQYKSYLSNAKYRSAETTLLHYIKSDRYVYGSRYRPLIEHIQLLSDTSPEATKLLDTILAEMNARSRSISSPKILQAILDDGLFCLSFGSEQSYSTVTQVTFHMLVKASVFFETSQWDFSSLEMLLTSRLKQSLSSPDCPDPSQLSDILQNCEDCVLYSDNFVTTFSKNAARLPRKKTKDILPAFLTSLSHPDLFVYTSSELSLPTAEIAASDSSAAGTASSADADTRMLPRKSISFFYPFLPSISTFYEIVYILLASNEKPELSEVIIGLDFNYLLYNFCAACNTSLTGGLSVSSAGDMLASLLVKPMALSLGDTNTPMPSFAVLTRSILQRSVKYIAGINLSADRDEMVSLSSVIPQPLGLFLSTLLNAILLSLAGQSSGSACFIYRCLAKLPQAIIDNAVTTDGAKASRPNKQKTSSSDLSTLFRTDEFLSLLLILVINNNRKVSGVGTPLQQRNGLDMIGNFNIIEHAVLMAIFRAEALGKQGSDFLLLAKTAFANTVIIPLSTPKSDHHAVLRANSILSLISLRTLPFPTLSLLFSGNVSLALTLGNRNLVSLILLSAPAPDLVECLRHLIPYVDLSYLLMNRTWREGPVFINLFIESVLKVFAEFPYEVLLTLYEFTASLPWVNPLLASVPLFQHAAARETQTVLDTLGKRLEEFFGKVSIQFHTFSSATMTDGVLGAGVYQSLSNDFVNCLLYKDIDPFVLVSLVTTRAYSKEIKGAKLLSDCFDLTDMSTGVVSLYRICKCQACIRMKSCLNPGAASTTGITTNSATGSGGSSPSDCVEDLHGSESSSSMDTLAVRGDAIILKNPDDNKQRSAGQGSQNSSGFSCAAAATDSSCLVKSRISSLISTTTHAPQDVPRVSTVDYMHSSLLTYKIILDLTRMLYDSSLYGANIHLRSKILTTLSLFFIENDVLSPNMNGHSLLLGCSSPLPGFANIVFSGLLYLYMNAQPSDNAILTARRKELDDYRRQLEECAGLYSQYMQVSADENIIGVCEQINACTTQLTNLEANRVAIQDRMKQLADRSVQPVGFTATPGSAACAAEIAAIQKNMLEPLEQRRTMLLATLQSLRANKQTLIDVLARQGQNGPAIVALKQRIAQLTGLASLSSNQLQLVQDEALKMSVFFLGSRDRQGIFTTEALSSYAYLQEVFASLTLGAGRPRIPTELDAALADSNTALLYSVERRASFLYECNRMGFSVRCLPPSSAVRGHLNHILNTVVEKSAAHLGYTFAGDCLYAVDPVWLCCTLFVNRVLRDEDTTLMQSLFEFIRGFLSYTSFCYKTLLTGSVVSMLNLSSLCTSQLSGDKPSTLSPESSVTKKLNSMDELPILSSNTLCFYNSVYSFDYYRAALLESSHVVLRKVLRNAKDSAVSFLPRLHANRFLLETTVLPIFYSLFPRLLTVHAVVSQYTVNVGNPAISGFSAFILKGQNTAGFTLTVSNSCKECATNYGPGSILPLAMQFKFLGTVLGATLTGSVPRVHQLDIDLLLTTSVQFLGGLLMPSVVLFLTTFVSVWAEKHCDATTACISHALSSFQVLHAILKSKFATVYPHLTKDRRTFIGNAIDILNSNAAIASTITGSTSDGSSSQGTDAPFPVLFCEQFYAALQDLFPRRLSEQTSQVSMVQRQAISVIFSHLLSFLHAHGIITSNTAECLINASFSPSAAMFTPCTLSSLRFFATEASQIRQQILPQVTGQGQETIRSMVHRCLQDYLRSMYPVTVDCSQNWSFIFQALRALPSPIIVADRRILRLNNLAIQQSVSPQNARKNRILKLFTDQEKKEMGCILTNLSTLLSVGASSTSASCQIGPDSLVQSPPECRYLGDFLSKLGYLRTLFGRESLDKALSTAEDCLCTLQFDSLTEDVMQTLTVLDLRADATAAPVSEWVFDLYDTILQVIQLPSRELSAPTWPLSVLAPLESLDEISRLVKQQLSSLALPIERPANLSQSMLDVLTLYGRNVSVNDAMRVQRAVVDYPSFLVRLLRRLRNKFLTRDALEVLLTMVTRIHDICAHTVCGLFQRSFPAIFADILLNGKAFLAVTTELVSNVKEHNIRTKASDYGRSNSNKRKVKKRVSGTSDQYTRNLILSTVEASSKQEALLLSLAYFHSVYIDVFFKFVSGSLVSLITSALNDAFTDINPLVTDQHRCRCLHALGLSLLNYFLRKIVIAVPNILSCLSLQDFSATFRSLFLGSGTGNITSEKNASPEPIQTEVPVLQKLYQEALAIELSILSLEPSISADMWTIFANSLDDSVAPPLIDSADSLTEYIIRSYFLSKSFSINGHPLSGYGLNVLITRHVLGSPSDLVGSTSLTGLHTFNNCLQCTYNIMLRQGYTVVRQSGETVGSLSARLASKASTSKLNISLPSQPTSGEFATVSTNLIHYFYTYVICEELFYIRFSVSSESHRCNTLLTQSQMNRVGAMATSLSRLLLGFAIDNVDKKSTAKQANRYNTDSNSFNFLRQLGTNQSASDMGATAPRVIACDAAHQARVDVVLGSILFSFSLFYARHQHVIVETGLDNLLGYACASLFFTFAGLLRELKPSRDDVRASESSVLSIDEAHTTLSKTGTTPRMDTVSLTTNVDATDLRLTYVSVLGTYIAVSLTGYHLDAKECTEHTLEFAGFNPSKFLCFSSDSILHILPLISPSLVQSLMGPSETLLLQQGNLLAAAPLVMQWLFTLDQKLSQAALQSLRQVLSSIKTSVAWSSRGETSRACLESIAIAVSLSLRLAIERTPDCMLCFGDYSSVEAMKATMRNLSSLLTDFVRKSSDKCQTNKELQEAANIIHLHSIQLSAIRKVDRASPKGTLDQIKQCIAAEWGQAASNGPLAFTVLALYMIYNLKDGTSCLYDDAADIEPSAGGVLAYLSTSQNDSLIAQYRYLADAMSVCAPANVAQEGFTNVFLYSEELAYCGYPMALYFLSVLARVGCLDGKIVSSSKCPSARRLWEGVTTTCKRYLANTFCNLLAMCRRSFNYECHWAGRFLDAYVDSQKMVLVAKRPCCDYLRDSFAATLDNIRTNSGTTDQKCLSHYTLLLNDVAVQQQYEAMRDYCSACRNSNLRQNPFRWLHDFVRYIYCAPVYVLLPHNACDIEKMCSGLIEYIGTLSTSLSRCDLSLALVQVVAYEFSVLEAYVYCFASCSHRSDPAPLLKACKHIHCLVREVTICKR